MKEWNSSGTGKFHEIWGEFCLITKEISEGSFNEANRTRGRTDLSVIESKFLWTEKEYYEVRKPLNWLAKVRESRKARNFANFS